MSDDLVDTGLSGGILVTTAVTPASLPESFTIPAAAALARDLAINMYDRPIILKKHSVTDEQCKALEAHPYFQKLLEQASLEWNSPRTITERLALEAAITLEPAILEIGARMAVKNEPLSGVVEAGKLLAKIAGAGEQKQQSAPGEKFTITINLGADTQTFTKTKPAIEGSALQPFAEGASSLLTLHTEPETT